MNNIPFIYKNYMAAELPQPFCCLTGKRVDFQWKFQFICRKFPVSYKFISPINLFPSLTPIGLRGPPEN